MKTNNDTYIVLHIHKQMKLICIETFQTKVLYKETTQSWKYLIEE